MKKSELRQIIREEVRKFIYEETEDDIAADKKAIDAEITAAKARIKVATANVKVARDKLAALTKRKSELNMQKPI